MNATDIIFGPLISEKSMNEVSKNRFTFKVSKSANKYLIKKAIEDKFKVNVIDISTITIKGRSLRAGVKRLEVLKQPFKKAIVTLREGQKIGLFDTSTQK